MSLSPLTGQTRLMWILPLPQMTTFWIPSQVQKNQLLSMQQSAKGILFFLIASKDNSTDYHFTLTASESTASYPNDVSILDGNYQTVTSDAVFQMWYVFDGQGNYEYWNWSYPSGNILMHYGSYTIWYPYLILEHDDEVEVFELDVYSNGIYLDGGLVGESLIQKKTLSSHLVSHLN